VTLPDGLQVRDVDRDTDLPRVVELLRTCDLYDSGITDASEAWLYDDWRSSSIKGAMVADARGFGASKKRGAALFTLTSNPGTCTEVSASQAVGCAAITCDARPSATTIEDITRDIATIP